ncbi:HAMP domain-containing histidine kinase [Budviciaceae bacterium CWB-B4]|uniref:histidine kinase n=1 Tax=Limnobaculum xujianqingii TaxID=2738837 RepID=A0A9D7AGL8_9GAMM|nr:HAMP domain-containing sensor histidine kinase [Limnobaculum xujianqingii]MBK5072305.1 HAMP domain-containing histidine kinase [Limnobaculum xujianqingii]MBK5175614.1 HAMP domain-containing histidine kinase [Limnobaculum xujianqingii]
MKSKKFLYLFMVVTVLIIGLIGYFGYRTLSQESTLNEYQTQQLAKTRVAQTQDFILQQLGQKQIRFSAILAYLKLDPLSLNTLIAQDSDIEALFVLEHNKLVFPDAYNPLNQKESRFIELITPIIQDPAILIAKQHQSDDKQPDFGWYVMQEQQQPVLIYWHKLNNQIIGFKLSYVKLLSDIVSSIDFNYEPDSLVISDNGQVLYQSLTRAYDKTKQPTYNQALPFPLHAWKIDYYASNNSNYSLYYFTIGLLAIAILAVGAIALSLYREFNRATRLASQQVSFVSQVSHELKTPLTNITLYAEMLKEMEQEEDSQNTHYLEVIISESRRLSRLIQNVLTFTKSPKINLQPVDINQLLAQIHTIFTPVFEAKGIHLALTVEGHLNTRSDIDRITQIISNLLSNAEKYAAEGKKVQLSASQDDESIYIRVRDYGKGLSDKELKHIFQPFYRVKSEITEGVTGTGIGLTIALQLAQSLSGTLIAENCDSGLEFTLCIPRT